MNMIQIKTSLIRARMEVMMLPTAELAEAIGVSTITMATILTRGTCKPTTLGKLALVLGINVWELIR